MKTIIHFFIGFALTMQTINVSAENISLNEKEQAVKTQIAKKLGNDFPKHLIKDAETAQVTFTVDTTGALHVKQVENNNTEIAQYLKDKIEGIIVSNVKDLSGKTFRVVLNLLLY
jgi:hypothetical protein